jgi:hypothetical protein
MPQARVTKSPGSKPKSGAAAPKKPATAKATAAKATAAKPAAAKPAAAKSTAAKPAAAKATAAKSTTAKPAAAKATAAKASSASASKSKAAAGAADARLEAAAQRLRKLNERIIDAGKEAGETTLSNYEKALKAIASSIEKGPGTSEIDWISHLATTQAKFIRDVTASWTSAARDMLK